MAAEGEQFIAAAGGSVPAGQPVELTVSGIPHHSSAGRWIALLLAAAIVGAGVWAWRGNDSEAVSLAGERQRLHARRDKLLADLARVEADYRYGRFDGARYAERRAALMASLEAVYGELDEDTPAPDGRSPAGHLTPPAAPRDAVAERSAANA